MDHSLIRVVGKERLVLGVEDFARVVRLYQRVVIDLGTGDGIFVLETARQSVETLVIGIDAAADNLEEVSRKAAGKVTRGGTPNCLFIVLSAECLPPFLAEIADELFINYPWGSLLKAVILPDQLILEKIAMLLKHGGTLHMLINYSVLKERGLRGGLNLPIPSTTVGNDDYLVQCYARAGLRIVHRELLTGEPSYRTRWARRLIRGSRRETLSLDAVKSTVCT